MPSLLDAQDVVLWVNSVKRNHIGKTYGSLKTAVVWTDELDKSGRLAVEVDPIRVVYEYNTYPTLLLLGHDPGQPIGKIIECKLFKSDDGVNFIASVLGCYSGGESLSFNSLGIDISSSIELPDIPSVNLSKLVVGIAFDPRDVDKLWYSSLVSDLPLTFKYTQLSHNSLDSFQELIRITLPIIALFGVSFAASFASEAAKDAYLALKTFFKKLVDSSRTLRDPIFCLDSLIDNCKVSFLIRGKKNEVNYMALDTLPTAAAQAMQIISRFRMADGECSELIYEYDKSTSRWVPSYLLLSDGRIISDNMKLIAIERLPNQLSMGFIVGDM